MAQFNSVKVVTNACLVDGTGKQHISDATILIKCNVIEEMRARARIMKAGAVEVDRC